MSDLYVNGSSFATGWNEEHKDSKLNTPSPSYAEFLAEILDAKLYKHCYNGKPPQTAVDQTIEFCEAYKEQHGSFDNLSVVIELTAIRYRQWQKVKTVNDELVQPISFVSREDIRDLELYFVKRHMNEDLSEYTEEVSINDILESELQKYYEEVEMWYPVGRQFSHEEIFKHINEAISHFTRAKKYFEDNSIDYLFWWVPGKTARTRKILGGISEHLGPRFLSNKIFYGTSVCDNDPDAYRSHPTIEGHKKLANALIDYATERNYLGINHG